MSVMRTRHKGGTPVVDQFYSLERVTPTRTYPTAFGSNGPYNPEHTICVDEVHKNHPYSGGPFSLRRVKVTYDYPAAPRGYTFSYQGGQYTYLYNGVRTVAPLVGTIPDDATDPTSDYGPDCWARFSPRPDRFQLARAFYELKDVKGLLLKRLRTLRSVGKNYLAVEFGWKPFIRDLRSFWRNLYNYDKSLAILKQQNAKWIRKSGILFDTISTGEVEDLSPQNYVIPNDAYQANRRSVVKTRVREKVWFVGCFRYFVPGLDDTSFIGKVRTFNRVFGVSLTPALVWELLPWSWLADWFGNVGPIIHNWSNITQNNLVAKYAYVMRMTENHATREYEADARLRDSYEGDYNLTKFSCAAAVTQTTKTRVPATPFGDFRLTLPVFTAWQLSILAALGISKYR